MSKVEDTNVDELIKNKFYCARKFTEEIEKVVLENKGNWSHIHTNIHEGLKNRGHTIKYNAFSSGLAVIKWHQGSWHGAADPRREGKAVSLP